MVRKLGFRPAVLSGLVLASFVFMLSLSTRTVSGRDSDDQTGRIAEGGGTTIIHGGTGSPGFTPVVTTVAFHAERSTGGITGEFDCLALAPGAPTGVAMASTVRVLGAGAAAGVGAIIAVGGDSLIRSGGGISLRLFGVMARRASRARAARPRRTK